MSNAATFVPEATSGSVTHVDIEARPEQVWDALLALKFTDLRITTPLLAIRSLPSLLAKRGSMGSGSSAPTMLEAMVDGRFVELDRDPPRSITIGLIGEFWKLTGGVDVEVTGPDEFEAFDEPGYVKTAMDFIIEPHRSGTRVTTTTANTTTSPDAATKFGRYWRVVGPGSKVIRLDMLHALKRRAESP
jgi:hypothetical protein